MRRENPINQDDHIVSTNKGTLTDRFVYLIKHYSISEPKEWKEIQEINPQVKHNLLSATQENEIDILELDLKI